MEMLMEMHFIFETEPQYVMLWMGTVPGRWVLVGMMITVGCLNFPGSMSVNHAMNAGDNLNSIQKRCA